MVSVLGVKVLPKCIEARSKIATSKTQDCWLLDFSNAIKEVFCWSIAICIIETKVAIVSVTCNWEGLRCCTVHALLKGELEVTQSVIKHPLYWSSISQ